MPDRLALHPHRGGFGAKEAVGVDLHLHPAVGKIASVTTVTMSTPSTCDDTMKGAGLKSG